MIPTGPMFLHTIISFGLAFEPLSFLTDFHQFIFDVRWWFAETLWISPGVGRVACLHLEPRETQAPTKKS